MSRDRWLDSRRLIGPNVVWQRPGALLEVAGEGPEFHQQLDRWTAETRALLDGLGWTECESRQRVYAGGALLILSAPVHALYTATEVAEEAWVLSARPEDPSARAAALERLRAARDEEADPAALALYQAARQRGKTCLVDEHGVSIGMGQHGVFYGPSELPAPESVDWDRLDDVPAVLVTGTNGKTTTVRLLKAMTAAADITAGLSSTDWIQVGDEVLDEGDYSGPGGARQVLRDPRTQLAILETARGGLLRRGIALDRARAAVVTNIAEDHLGDGGIHTVDDLAEVKFMVTGVLGEEGVAVLNHDDPRCRVHGQTLPGPVAWFSLEPPTEGGDRWYWLDDGVLRRRIGEDTVDLIAAVEAPITLGGSALHNVANALAAAAAAEALGVPLDGIRQALAGFGADIDDNPGRANYTEIGGRRVLLDFAHNPDGMQAIFDAGRAMGAPRTAVVFGQAGDRTDEAIRDLTRSVVASGVDYFVIKDMGEYRRGREPDEVPGIILAELASLGIDEDHIVRAETEPEAAELAYRWAQPGDLLMLFIHSERDAVIERLRSAAD